MRAAVIELRIDPLASPGMTKLSKADTLVETLRRQPRERAAAVKAALDQAIEGDATWIVFPGWTLVARGPPSWLVKASAGRTIAFECLYPDDAHERGSSATKAPKTQRRFDGHEDAFAAPWRTFVARNGRVVVAGRQRMAIGKLRDVHGPRFLDDLTNGHRYFDDGVLWICGEVEILEGGGKSEVRNGTGCADAELQRRVVLNPSHTKEGPQASRSKRAWLSKNGWLLKAANTFSGKWSYWWGTKAASSPRRGPPVPRV